MNKLYTTLALVCATVLITLGVSKFRPSKKEAPTFVVANVLDQEYYEDSHIEGSINVPFMELEEYAENNWNKEKTHIVLYCGNYKCTASGAGAKMLRKLGFKHATAYEGGTAEWLHKGYSVKGACTQAYLKDYEAPEGFQEKLQKEGDLLVTAETLQQKMQTTV